MKTENSRVKNRALACEYSSCERIYKVRVSITSSRRSVSLGAARKTACEKKEARREEAKEVFSLLSSFFFSRAIFGAAPKTN